MFLLYYILKTDELISNLNALPTPSVCRSRFDKCSIKQTYQEGTCLCPPK